jgi:hypothetical protein
MCTFSGGELYFDSKFDLDTDGSAYYTQDPSGQKGTSCKMADGSSLDADRVNYFVLPGGLADQLHIALGDIAIILWRGRVAYACYGDSGPVTKLGEGSISLHRSLGHETIHHHTAQGGGTLINEGISGVITIVFPGSGNGHALSNTAMEALGKPLFAQLKKDAAVIGDFPTPSTWMA